MNEPPKGPPSRPGDSAITEGGAPSSPGMRGRHRHGPSNGPRFPRRESKPNAETPNRPNVDGSARSDRSGPSGASPSVSSPSSPSTGGSPERPPKSGSAASHASQGRGNSPNPAKNRPNQDRHPQNRSNSDRPPKNRPNLPRVPQSGPAHPRKPSRSSSSPNLDRNRPSGSRSQPEFPSEKAPPTGERHRRNRGRGPRSQPPFVAEPLPSNRSSKDSGKHPSLDAGRQNRRPVQKDSGPVSHWESVQESGKDTRKDAPPVAATFLPDSEFAPTTDEAAGQPETIVEFRPTLQLELPKDLPFEVAPIAGVRFRPGGFLHELMCADRTVEVGDLVLCETDRGPRLGRVETPCTPRPSLKTLRRILRKARPDETSQFADIRQRESEAYRFCKERLRECKLPMKLLSVDLVPGQRATFYFASEERVDFRDLVRDLSQRFKLRIEMRQVGARDGAKVIGGVGTCGRELCCSSFLPSFSPVSIRMAKDQGMVLNPGKLAGQCGRLKCCLLYEHETYKALGHALPKLGKRVQTPDGIGKVLDLDILRQRVRVYLEEQGAKTYDAAVLSPIGTGKDAAPAVSNSANPDHTEDTAGDERYE